MALRRAGFGCSLTLRAKRRSENLSSLAADSSGQLNIFGHDGDPLGVDGAQVGVFEQTDQVSLASFLQGHHSRALESQISLEILGDFSNQTLEGQFTDQQLGRLLVPSDLSESDGSGPVTMRFLDTTGRRCALSSRLGSQLLPRGFATSRFSGSLLSTGHFSTMIIESNEADFATSSGIYTSC